MVTQQFKPLDFTGERVVPYAPGMRGWVHVLQDHLQRYTWTLGAVSGKKVLDIGCGTGYGSAIMGFVAQRVQGVDIDREAISYARYNFERDYFPATFPCSVRFTESDIQDFVSGKLLWFPSEVYTCFEVLEHITNPKEVVKSIVKQTNPEPGTLFIWSIPVNDAGQFHKVVYSVEDIESLFPVNAHYYQLTSLNGGIVGTKPVDTSDIKYVLGITDLGDIAKWIQEN